MLKLLLSKKGQQKNSACLDSSSIYAITKLGIEPLQGYILLLLHTKSFRKQLNVEAEIELVPCCKREEEASFAK